MSTFRSNRDERHEEDFDRKREREDISICANRVFVEEERRHKCRRRHDECDRDRDRRHRRFFDVDDVFIRANEVIFEDERRRRCRRDRDEW